MTEQRYNELLKDSEVMRGDRQSSGFFYFAEHDIVIQWQFHFGPYPSDFPNDLPRVILKVFPKSDYLLDDSIKPIESSRMVMVFAEDADYALSYLITVDDKSRKVKMVISDLPELGDGEIQNNENDGIILPY